ncbi:MAG: hypothetical protein WC006_08635 [Bacilli bacterium]|nr:hypothetical protein [Bacilli bacterium]
MKMKKMSIVFVIIAIVLLVNGCSSKYKGYKQVDLPDSKTGSIKIPDNWKTIIDDDGWINIIDSDTNSLVGVQYYYGEYYQKGLNEYDTRVYNPYFKNYNFTESQLKSGNSNGGQWGIYTLEIENGQNEFLYLWIFGKESYYDYAIRIIIIDSMVDSTVLDNIAKSYRRYD